VHRDKKNRKLSLTTDVVRRLGRELRSDELARAAGGWETATVCPTVMQTHCQSCRNGCTDWC
jgi:hypothetical protein